MKYKHYSPKCATMLFSFAEKDKANAVYRQKLSEGIRVYLMCDEQTAQILQPEHVLLLGKTETEVAANLYDKLREAEGVCDLLIAVAPEKQDGVMVGVMNRLTKACHS
jgi:hypothetical protein